MNTCQTIHKPSAKALAWCRQNTVEAIRSTPRTSWADQIAASGLARLIEAQS